MIAVRVLIDPSVDDDPEQVARITQEIAEHLDRQQHAGVILTGGTEVGTWEVTAS